jgi:hypothetical protein
MVEFAHKPGYLGSKIKPLEKKKGEIREDEDKSIYDLRNVRRNRAPTTLLQMNRVEKHRDELNSSNIQQIARQAAITLGRHERNPTHARASRGE